ncbi:glycine-rich RNA-binding protein 4, mitochondrial [Pyrus x bretschneideri]|uniref:glycine-rich RNA-binding protein 4, mitochondrial n=1 Tax=Pyrus x bretschneideri TaxID=225117 RepID=UPI00202E0D7E|nr:glycine-rich RNA-binding protein 4, mitochondrial [Pyrus x bretschneideri]
MAFLSKIGSILRQTANKQIRSEVSPLKLSIHQAIRCMSSMASSKLFIGGISYQTDDQSLREAFQKYGEVVEARIIMDRESGRSRGFGFITFTSSEEASSAIQALDGQELHGRRVRVNYATDRPRPSYNNYGDGQSSYGSGGGNNYGNYGPSGGDSYGRGNTGYGQGSYNSPGNYPSANAYDAPGGGFGNSNNFGAGTADNFSVGGDNSFGTASAPFGENKTGFGLDDPLEGNDRDDDDAGDFAKRA